MKDEVKKVAEYTGIKTEELKQLMEKAHVKKDIEREGAGLLKGAEVGLKGMKEVLDSVPSHIGKMLYSCDEMLKDSEPDSSADYWEEKDDIKKHIEEL